MPKIILATDAWKPQVNGVVKCVEEIKKQLESKGFEVIVIHSGLFFSVPFPFYPEIRLSLFSQGKIKKIIKAENPDYIHIFTESGIGLTTRSVCIKNNLKFTTSQHTNFQHYTEHYLKFKSKIIFNVINSFLKWFHNKSFGTMVITKEFEKQFKENGFLHIKFWPLGTDTDLFKKNENSKIKEKYNLKSPIFVYFGRIAKEKNVEEFLGLNLPGTKLVIGDGPIKSALEKRYGLPRGKAGNTNIFVGYKMGQELVDFLSVCDVFVFPSLTDTFPLAIIEALSCELPVACHNVMNLDKLVTKEVGVLNNDLKKAAIECLNISHKKCREYALKFSWKKSTEYFINNLIKTK